MKPIIFLDIDGVLNKHSFVVNYCCGFNTKCVRNFNRIIRATNANIVLSSAWRYMITGGAMTLRGFQYLLWSHGVKGDLIGHTCSDEEIMSRSLQIRKWVKDNKVDNYVVLDDMKIVSHPFIQTISQLGLTKENAEEAINILTSSLRTKDVPSFA